MIAINGCRTNRNFTKRVSVMFFESSLFRNQFTGYCLNM